MNRQFVLVFGVVSYLVFFGTFLYAIGFVGNVIVPKGVDSGTEQPLGFALLVDVALLGIFGIQHSVMARPRFKAWWTRIVPHSIERSVYVLLASLALILLFWQWRPITTVVWSVGSEALRYVVDGVSLAGWLIVLLGTFMIGHFELFGLQQVFTFFSGRERTPAAFATPGFYKFVRHPIMLGFIVAFWAASRMTVGHLLFAAVASAYILVAIQLEERDLGAFFGPTYADYRKRVPMLLPTGRRAGP